MVGGFSFPHGSKPWANIFLSATPWPPILPADSLSNFRCSILMTRSICFKNILFLFGTNFHFSFFIFHFSFFSVLSVALNTQRLLRLQNS